MQWTRGEWVLPPKGCYYAPPRTGYEDLDVGTALVFRAGAWLPYTKGLITCEQPRPCPDENATQEFSNPSTSDTRGPS